MRLQHATPRQIFEKFPGSICLERKLTFRYQVPENPMEDLLKAIKLGLFEIKGAHTHCFEPDAFLAQSVIPTDTVQILAEAEVIDPRRKSFQAGFRVPSKLEANLTGRHLTIEASGFFAEAFDREDFAIPPEITNFGRGDPPKYVTPNGEIKQLRSKKSYWLDFITLRRMKDLKAIVRASQSDTGENFQSPLLRTRGRVHEKLRDELDYLKQCYSSSTPEQLRNRGYWLRSFAYTFFSENPEIIADLDRLSTRDYAEKLMGCGNTRKPYFDKDNPTIQREKILLHFLRTHLTGDQILEKFKALYTCSRSPTSIFGTNLFYSQKELHTQGFPVDSTPAMFQVFSRQDKSNSIIIRPKAGEYEVKIKFNLENPELMQLQDYLCGRHGLSFEKT